MICATVDPHALPSSANPEASTGVLLCHGFTGSPASMRPWAESLADAGLRVDLPRLPGHGTVWQEAAITRWIDWYRVVEQHWHVLHEQCEQVFVAGLSMGGSLALRLAEEHQVDGVMLVNPAIGSDQRRMRALGLAKHLLPSISAISGDIARPGADEHGYPRTPLAPAHSMTELWELVQRDLGRVQADVLLMTSTTDHVVDGASARLLTAALPHVERVELTRSHHVATLDHDDWLIHERSLAFIEARRHAREDGR